ncbi:hypothetical protein STEG23_014006 [Scotinomys teguina]
MTKHLATKVDPTIKMNPSISVSSQNPLKVFSPISPVTITDLISPHHLLLPLTILVGPVMNLNLNTTVNPTSMADSTKVDTTIMEGPIKLSKLCTTSLLSHTAKGKFPTVGNPIMVLCPAILVNPIIKRTTTAGLNILDPEDSLTMERPLPSNPLRGPSTRKDLTSMVAIMQAPKPPITMASIPTTESTITTENYVMESIFTTENIPTITSRASPNSLPHSSPTAQFSPPLLLWEPKAQSTACLSPTWQLDLMALTFPVKFIPRTAPKNQTPGMRRNTFKSAKGPNGPTRSSTLGISSNGFGKK